MVRPAAAVTSANGTPKSGFKAKNTTTRRASAILGSTRLGIFIRRSAKPVLIHWFDQFAPRASITTNRAFVSHAVSAWSAVIIRVWAEALAAWAADQAVSVSLT